MSTFVLTTPKSLTEAAMARVGEQLRDWEANGHPPIALQDGMQMSVLGGLTVKVMLSAGPLDGLSFSVTVASLTDLPPSFEYFDGAYRPWLSEHAGWMHTSEGVPVYEWIASA